MSHSSSLAALFLGLGLAAAGFFVGRGIAKHNAPMRSISVKGLAEKEAPASIAIWSINYNAAGNAVAEVNAQLEKNSAAVVAFLQKQGFNEKEFSVQPPAITDLSLQEREKDAKAPDARFRATQSVLLRTQAIEKIKPALAASSALVAAGVQLDAATPKFIFNRLNEIKPGMIQEATHNARIAAEQFARDSQAALGSLRSASQGWFQIEDRDPATPEQKVIRVVVDVQYEVR